MSFQFIPQSIPDVILVTTTAHYDHRGQFSEVYRENEFSKYGIGPFVQENYSFSGAGVVRGLHYQIEPMSVGKLVSCPHGLVYDVAVDIRKGSPTFGKYVGAYLRGNTALWVPPGFAHGFCVMSNEAYVLYRQTQYHSKDHDRSLRWNDPEIAINWPYNGKEAILSSKDAIAPLLKDI